MNDLYKGVLELLRDDARYSAEKIAVMLGVNTEDVKNCIADLESKGVIVKYTAVVNEEKTGNDFVEAWIEVKVTPQHSLGFDAIAEEIYSFDEVTSVYLMSGSYDLAVTVTGRTLREVAMFVSEKLSAMDTVTSTATHFILKKYKSDGVLFEEGDKLRRIAVQP